MTERAVIARSAAPSCHCEARRAEAISSQGGRHAPLALAMTERAVIARSAAPSCHCEARRAEAISSQGGRHAPSGLAMTERAVIARSVATKQSPVHVIATPCIQRRAGLAMTDLQQPLKRCHADDQAAPE